jgi:hypothetical protein
LILASQQVRTNWRAVLRLPITLTCFVRDWDTNIPRAVFLFYTSLTAFGVADWSSGEVGNGITTAAQAGLIPLSQGIAIKCCGVLSPTWLECQKRSSIEIDITKNNTNFNKHFTKAVIVLYFTYIQSRVGLICRRLRRFVGQIAKSRENVVSTIQVLNLASIQLVLRRLDPPTCGLPRLTVLQDFPTLLEMLVQETPFKYQNTHLSVRLRSCPVAHRNYT